MKITDLKCAVIGDNPVIRITTDEGIDGWGEAENSKPYLEAARPFLPAAHPGGGPDQRGAGHAQDSQARKL